MKKYTKRSILSFMLLFGMLVLSACGSSETSEKNAGDKTESVKVTPVFGAKYIQIKEEFNKELLTFAEAAKKKKLSQDKAASFYSHKNAKLYDDEALTGEGESIEHKSEIIVDLPKNFDKTQLEDENLVFKTVSINGDVVTKYIRAKDVYPERYDFIEMPEEGVSYEAFEKKTYEDNPPIKMRGVYVSQASAANGAGNLDYLLDLAKTTDINTFVIDVKDDSGNLLFYSKAAEKYMPEQNNHVAIKDIKTFIKKLKDEDIYLVARIVTFKSPEYALKYPEKAIKYKGSGELFKSGDGLKWATPYDRDLWDYNISVAEEAADLGFNEIQFDYVRFPDVSANTNTKLDFHNDNNETKTQAIHKFLTEAYKRLSQKHVYVTADFFGFVATAVNDQFIGQHWESVVNVVDYAAPMVYPSHYGGNNFGLAVPDAHPYECIDGAMKDAINRNKNLYTPAKLRPWIQDFTAGWVRGHINYGKAELMAQIQALKDNGIDEYMVWNAGNRYTNEGLKNDK